MFLFSSLQKLMGNFDIRLLLAGIGILLFGMNTFEEGLKELAGKKMKYYLEKYTRNAFRSVMTGSFVTGVLQSSSLISLLLLGFVGAGMMALPNAIGVIIGANIGTTLDALYVSLLGFGEFKISAFAMPIIAIGGLLLITAGGNKKRLWRGKLLVGFGLLFIGIDFMKESVEQLKASIDLEQYANMSLWGFGLLGVIVTMIIQSSSATSVLTFTALASGLINFEASVAIVMGANIGTTATSVIASLGGKMAKRQLALAQVLFNVLSGLVGVLLFWWYIRVTGMIVSIENDPVFANAVLNAMFNVSTAIIFSPFIMQLTRLVQWLIPDKKEEGVGLGIDEISLWKQQDTHLTADLMLQTANNDVKQLLRETMEYNSYIWGMLFEDLETDSFSLADLKQHTVSFDNEIHRKMYDDNQDIADKLLVFLDEVEKLKDSGDVHTGNSTQEYAIVNCVGSMKHIKNIRHNLQALRDVSSGELYDLYNTLRESTALLYRQLTTVVSRNFTTDNISELDDAIGKIKSLYADNIGRLATLGKKAGDEELDSSSLINMTREIYDSATRMVDAVAVLYLSRDEKKMLEKVG